MNYIILIGIALFFVFVAARDGTMGWDWHNGTMTLSIGDGDRPVRIRGEGAIDLKPDGSGVATLSNNGSLDVRMTSGGTQRRVLFTDADCTVKQQFFVDNEEQPWGPDADRFVAEVMPVVLRETALNVDERVAWLIANRGQTALLDEIELIKSDFAQRAYTVRYAETATIADADLQRLVKAAGDHISSDFDLRTTLEGVYDAQKPTGESFVSLLSAGKTISSDFDARTLLEHLGPTMASTPAAITPYLDLVGTISSDFDMRMALSPIVTNVALSDDAVAQAIELAGGAISSDFDLRTLLAESAQRVGASDTLARAYTKAADSISGDFDQRETLTALADRAALTPAGWQLLIESAENISSDFDCATLLMSVAPKLPRDDGVRAAYRRALQSISSDFDRQRAAGALAEQVL